MGQELDSILVELDVFAVNDGSDVWMQGCLVLIINGKRPYSEDDIVITDTFLKSLDNDGEHFIFSCHCGIPECTGWEKGIEVSTFDNIIKWKNLNNNESWSFDKNRISSQVDSIREEVLFFKQYFKKKGIHYVGVGFTW